MTTTLNYKALKFFDNLAKKDCTNPFSVKLAHNTDYTDIDAKFILKYANKTSSILDIGTGSGLIVNKIYDKVGSIECIEPYEIFTKFITKSPNVKIINNNIMDYKTSKTYDIITLFGFMHYVEKCEAIEIYKKCYKFLKTNGIIIIKNQFGINDNINVSGYSKEQNADYYAQYRQIDKEMDLLKKVGFKQTEKFDIYPPEANRWDNTHFYAIVGVK